MIRLLSVILLTAFLAVSLSACGKKGAPKPPSENSQYPRTYPSAK
jgi:predicted small lipoprotein YifL